MNTNKITAIIIVIAYIICLTGIVEAATFNVETIICAPSWYCTAYSEENCGTRTCVDTNVCGTNINKPIEFLDCSESDSDKSGRSSGSGYVVSNALPTGYFTTDTDVIPITVDQGTITQKIIFVNTTMSGEHILKIEYPSSYISGTDFLTTSNNNKSIEYEGDFNIIVDARNVLTGTYVIPIIISNKYHSKTIQVIIDVVSQDSPDIELYVDSKIKTIGVDKEIITNINVKGIKLWAGENITYALIDPKGNSLFTEDRTIIDSSNIEERIALPPNIGEGYYTLSVKLRVEEKEYSKSLTFTVFAPDRYSPILENPQRSNIIKKNLVWIIIIIALSAVILINSLTSDKYSRRRIASRKWRRQLAMNGPLININFNARERIKEFSEKFKKHKESNENDKLELMKKRNDILRNSYEKGFISLTEYSAAIHSQGTPTNKEKEHIRREEERYKREAESKKAKEEKMFEEKKKEEEKKRIEEKRKEREEAEEQKEREEKKKEERKKEEEKREKEEKREEERRKEEEKERKEAKKKEEERIAQMLEKREEKLIEKIVEKLDKSDTKTESEEKHKKEDLEKHENHAEKDIKTAPTIAIKSEILDKRARDSEAFVLNNNELLYSLRDLLNALPHMSEHVLHHHIKHGRNDFANWISDVFRYEDMAEAIRKADNKEEIIVALKHYE